jgi:hypothetical protein
MWCKIDISVLYMIVILLCFVDTLFLLRSVFTVCVLPVYHSRLIHVWCVIHQFIAEVQSLLSCG